VPWRIIAPPVSLCRDEACRRAETRALVALVREVTSQQQQGLTFGEHAQEDERVTIGVQQGLQVHAGILGLRTAVVASERIAYKPWHTNKNPGDPCDNCNQSGA
jgi:hypothetical protein